MTYTHEQLEGFKAAFATRRKRQLLVTLPMIAAFLAIGLGSGAEGGDVLGIPSQVLTMAAVVLALLLVVFSFQNWRCPACNGYLGRYWGPKYCPKCGVALV